MIYKSYKYCNGGRYEIYMEGSRMILCMSKCDKRKNTNSAGEAPNNKSCNAQSCDPLGLKSYDTNSV